MSDTSGFARFVPGFEFLQNLAGQAGSGMAQGMPQMPSLGNWVAPTFSVEELDKRITELKAVQFWLDQNAKALAATIQALEVQKMTLAALQQMNVSLGDVANAFQVKPSSHEAPAPTAPPAPATETAEEAPEPPPEDSPAAPRKTRGKGRTASTARAGAPAGIDPVAWWGALSQQFQQIASTAMQDMARQGTPEGAAAPSPAPSKTRRSATKDAKPSSRARTPAAKKTRAKPTRR